MIVEDVWAQLETDLAWRQAELRTFSNLEATTKRSSDRGHLRRAMLVMLYAHAEGFCKVALMTYINAINRTRTACTMAPEVLVAAAWANVFHALQFGDTKRSVFSAPPHDDPKLVTIARQREFVHELPRLLGQTLQIPDTAVNTEDNLSSKVVRRNLYRLGFPEDLLDAYGQVFDELLRRRCDIAHGSDPDPVKQTDYERLRKGIFQAMDHLALSVASAVENKSFVRAAAPLP